MLEQLKKFNHLIIGGIIGLLVPLTAMYFILKFTTNLSLSYILGSDYFSPVVNNLKGCLFFNLGVLFIFYWFKKDQSARGVILATLIYGAIYLWYMIFM